MGTAGLPLVPAFQSFAWSAVYIVHIHPCVFQKGLIPLNHHLHEFCRTTRELLASDQVRMMGRWQHHGQITTLDHSLFVAYWSYRIARKFGWDEIAAARGGLLHDLYLYDSKDKSAHPGLQCFDHPRAAARNAAELTPLSEKERNIILAHMWPLGGQLPRSREAWLVDLVDTICASLELSHIYHPGRLRERMGVRPLLQGETPAPALC